MEPILLISRWLHILAAAVAIGGPILMAVALRPALQTLPEDERSRLHEAFRRRWSMLVMAAIAFLLLTGFYNYFVFLRTSRGWGEGWQTGSDNARLYNVLFGVKFLLALAVFVLASALSGRSKVFAPLRANAKTWLAVQVVLVVLIVMVAGQMRMMHVGPNLAPAPSSSSP